MNKREIYIWFVGKSQQAINGNSNGKNPVEYTSDDFSQSARKWGYAILHPIILCVKWNH